MKKTLLAALAALMMTASAFALEVKPDPGYSPHPADEGKTLADKPTAPPPAADKKVAEPPPPAADASAPSPPPVAGTLVTAPPLDAKSMETAVVEPEKLSDDGTSGLIWDPRVKAWMTDTRPK